MRDNRIKNYLKNKAKENLNIAIDELKASFDSTNSTHFNSFILTEFQLKELNIKKNTGLVSEQEYSIENTKILYRLMSVIDDIENVYEEYKPSKFFYLRISSLEEITKTLISEKIFVGEKLSIGRNENCDICITHNTISRIHCQLIVTSNSFGILDNNSKNGVIYKGNKVAEAFFKVNDILQIGKCQLKIIDPSPTYDL